MAENLRKENVQIADEKMKGVTGGTGDNVNLCPYCGAEIGAVEAGVQVVCPKCGQTVASARGNGSLRFG